MTRSSQPPRPYQPAPRPIPAPLDTAAFCAKARQETAAALAQLRRLGVPVVQK